MTEIVVSITLGKHGEIALEAAIEAAEEPKFNH